MPSLKVFVLPQIQIASEKLIKSIQSETKIKLDNCQDLWSVFEQLSKKEFARLKKDVYFADFLRCLSLNEAAVGNSNSDTKLHSKPTSVQSPITAKPELEQIKSNVTTAAVVNDEVNPITKSIEDTPQTTSTFSPDAKFNLDESLDKVSLPKQYLRLIVKVKNSNKKKPILKIGNTLRQFLALPEDQLQELPYFGPAYLKLFKELKAHVAKGSVKNSL